MNEEEFSRQQKQLAHNPGYLLWHAANAWQRTLNEALSALKLTHVQFVLLGGLYWLSEQQDAVTQGEVGDWARIEKVMASNVLRTLEAKGWLTRKPHPLDTRAKLLTITPAGRVVFRAAVERVEQVTTQFFGQIPAALRQPFLEGLGQLVVNPAGGLTD